MSRKELDRLSIIQRVDRKELSQEAAAKMMSRSARQVRRLLDRYKEYGEQGLISKHRGKPSNNRLPDVLRQQIAEIVSEHYADFGPTLAQEKLLERHDIKLSVETLRQIMTQVGLWKPKRKRQPAVHQLRERRPCRGELIQIDGSPHASFEDRGPRCRCSSRDTLTGLIRMNRKYRQKYGQSSHEKCPYSVHKIIFLIFYSIKSMTYMAEEVGVEPTSGHDSAG